MLVGGRRCVIDDDDDDSYDSYDDESNDDDGRRVGARSSTGVVANTMLGAMNQPADADQFATVHIDVEDVLLRVYGIADTFPLPTHVRRFVTSGGRRYYYNVLTRRTVWLHPELQRLIVADNGRAAREAIGGSGADQLAGDVGGVGVGVGSGSVVVGSTSSSTGFESRLSGVRSPPGVATATATSRPMINGEPAANSLLGLGESPAAGVAAAQLAAVRSAMLNTARENRPLWVADKEVDQCASCGSRFSVIRRKQ